MDSAKPVRMPAFFPNIQNSMCVHMHMHMHVVHYAKAPAALPEAAMLFEIQEKHTGPCQRHILF